MSTELKNIKDRLEADKDEFAFAAGYDQSIRDREYLLAIVEDQGKILKALTLDPMEFRSSLEDELLVGLAADKAEEDLALGVQVYLGTERIK